MLSYFQNTRKLDLFLRKQQLATLKKNHRLLLILRCIQVQSRRTTPAKETDFPLFYCLYFRSELGT